MMMSKALADEFHALSQDARRAGKYEQALVYSTAEDLTDGMLKGIEAAGLPALHSAFTANFELASDAGESEAWAKACEMVESRLSA